MNKSMQEILIGVAMIGMGYAIWQSMRSAQAATVSQTAPVYPLPVSDSEVKSMTDSAVQDIINGW